MPKIRPPPMDIVTGINDDKIVVLAPQIILANTSYPLYVVPKRCCVDGGANGTGLGGICGTTRSCTGYMVSQGANMANIAMIKIIINPIIVRGLARCRNNLLLDFIFSISYSCSENSGSRQPGIK